MNYFQLRTVTLLHWWLGGDTSYHLICTILLVIYISASTTSLRADSVKAFRNKNYFFLYWSHFKFINKKMRDIFVFIVSISSDNSLISIISKLHWELYHLIDVIENSGIYLCIRTWEPTKCPLFGYIFPSQLRQLIHFPLLAGLIQTQLSISWFGYLRQCTLSRGSLYEVIFSDIIIIITIMITIICLFAAVVPPMEGTTDSVHFG